MVNGESVKAGSVIDATNADAALLIGMGKARAASAAKAQPEGVSTTEAPKKTRKTATATEE